MDNILHIDNNLHDDAFLEELEQTRLVNVDDYTLKYICERLGGIGGHQDEMGYCFNELWRRYILVKSRNLPIG
jgi:hypothetical protein